MLGHYLPVGPLRTLSFLGALMMASALLPQVGPGPDLVRSQGARSDSQQRAEQDRQALPADFNDTLEATRATLEELVEATAKVAAYAERRDEEVQRLKLENERLAAEVRRGAEAAREAERAQQELIAAKAEIQRLMLANAEFEKHLIALGTESISATEAPRELQKIANPNADLVGDARFREALSPGNSEGMPTPVESEEPATAALSSERTQPPAPERAAAIDAGQPTATAPELPTESPEEATSETGSGLAEFRASIQVLNDLERSTAGVDLFSDIASVDDRVVQINATPAWDALPPIAKETYLDMLLHDWVATQGGDGPAVVRIIDPSGRVLIEKSSP